MEYKNSSCYSLLQYVSSSYPSASPSIQYSRTLSFPFSFFSFCISFHCSHSPAPFCFIPIPFVASSCECVNDWRVCNHDNLNWNNCVLYIWCWFSEHHSVPHWRETCTIVFRSIELFRFAFLLFSLIASFIFIWITLILVIVVLPTNFACTSFWWMYMQKR